MRWVIVVLSLSVVSNGSAQLSQGPPTIAVPQGYELVVEIDVELEPDLEDEHEDMWLPRLQAAVHLRSFPG